MILDTDLACVAEHGAIMVANVFTSRCAVESNAHVIRAFTKLRAALAGQADLACRLANIDKTLIEHGAGLSDLRQKSRPLLVPTAETKQREIGGHAKGAAPDHRRSR